MFRRKTKPVMEVLLRCQVGDLEVFIEKEGKTVRVRTVDLKTGVEAHRKEVEL